MAGATGKGCKAVAIDLDIGDDEEQPPPERSAKETVHVERLRNEQWIFFSSQDAEARVVGIGSS